MNQLISDRAEGSALIEAHQIRVRRSRKFTLQVDDFVAGVGLTIVRGPNGAGKSTLIQALAGEYGRGVGRLAIGGFDLRHRSQRARGLQVMGYAPQHLALPRQWRVGDYLEVAAWLKGQRPGDATGSAADACEAAELDPSMRISRMSGGMQRRLAIAQAIVAHPQVLLLDEPFVAIDADSQKALMRMLDREKQSMAIVVIDHTETAASLQHLEFVLRDGAPA